jgi:hypothetical protein
MLTAEDKTVIHYTLNKQHFSHYCTQRHESVLAYESQFKINSVDSMQKYAWYYEIWKSLDKVAFKDVAVSHSTIAVNLRQRRRFKASSLLHNPQSNK